MADRDDPSPAGDPTSSDDETETIKGDHDNERIAEILEEERQSSATPAPLGNGLVSDRYREILHDQREDGSEDGSTGPVGKRPASPVDSLLSVPDDSPSVQVGAKLKQ